MKDARNKVKYRLYQDEHLIQKRQKLQSIIFLVIVKSEIHMSFIRSQEILKAPDYL
jgi:hypothetical protein